MLRNPANRSRAVPLTYEQFKYGFANMLDDDEAHKLYEEYSVAGPGKVLFQAASANLNPWTEDKVDTENPERGPMLILAGEKDHTVPHGGRKRLVQARAPQPRRDRDRRDRGPRSLVDDRPMLARGLRQGARVRQAVRVAAQRSGELSGRGANSPVD